MLSTAVLSLVLTVIYEDDDCEEEIVSKKELNCLIECNRLRKDLSLQASLIIKPPAKNVHKKSTSSNLVHVDL